MMNPYSNKKYITNKYNINKILKELEPLKIKKYCPLTSQYKPLTKKQEQDLEEQEEQAKLKQKKSFEEMYNIMTPLEKNDYHTPHVIKKNKATGLFFLKII